jgi:hypothetical protein
MTTPNYCPSDLPPCPQPAPCEETFDSNCIVYTGEDLPCIDVTTGDSVQTIISTLNDLLEPFFCLQCTTLMVPADASTNVAYDQVLTWGAVQGATSYNVYFGTSSTNLVLVSSGQVGTSYTYPYPFLEGTKYYWKVVPINAGGPASNCPTYSFTTKTNTCVNPVSYMLNATYTDNVAPITSAEFITAIETYLDNGELLTNCNFCCPDCTDTHRYVLASAEVFSKYYTTFYNTTSCPPPCCIEVDASLTAMSTATPPYLSLATAFAQNPPITNCCGTNFSECSQALKNVLGSSKPLVYQVLGIVEESTISGSTALCILSTFLTTTSYTDLEQANIVNAILAKGLVIDCRPEGTIISSINTYVDYINTVQNGCFCYTPCTQK